MNKKLVYFILFSFFQTFPLFFAPFVNIYPESYLEQKYTECVEYYIEKQRNILEEMRPSITEKQIQESLEHYKSIFDDSCHDISTMAVSKYNQSNIVILFFLIILPVATFSSKMTISLICNSNKFFNSLNPLFSKFLLKLLILLTVVFLNFFSLAMVWNFGLRKVEPPFLLKIKGFEMFKGDKMIFEGRFDGTKE